MADLPYIQEAQEVKITGQDSTGNTVNYVSADSNGNLFVKDYADGPVSPGTVASASILIGGQYNSTLPTLTTGQQSAIQLDSNGRLITNLTDRTLTGTLGALNASLTLPLLADSSGTLQISGTWVGTITVYASVDGTTYNQVVYTTSLQTAYANPGITANGFYRIFLRGGFQSLQVVMTSYTSGTATVTIFASSAVSDVGVVQFNASNLNAQVVGNIAAGNADSGNGVKISGVYNTSLPTLTNGLRGDLQLDSNGRVIIRPLTSSDVVSSAQSGTWNINNISGTVSLPTGAATSALQTSANTILSTIATNTGAANTDFTTTGTITALNGTVSVYGQGVYTVTASVTGTWVGTLVMEGQAADNNWYALQIYKPSNNTNAFISSITANGLYAVVGGGFLNIRIRASAYTSGTVNVSLDGSLAQQSILAGQLGTWNVASNTQDGSGNSIASYNSQLDVADIINTSISSGSITVSTTSVAARVGGSNLTNRKFITISPVTQIVYLGATSGVTTTTGIPIYPGQTIGFGFSANVTPYLIAASSTSVIVLEGA